MNNEKMAEYLLKRLFYLLFMENDSLDVNF